LLPLLLDQLFDGGIWWDRSLGLAGLAAMLKDGLIAAIAVRISQTLLVLSFALSVDRWPQISATISFVADLPAHLICASPAVEAHIQTSTHVPHDLVVIRHKDRRCDGERRESNDDDARYPQHVLGPLGVPAATISRAVKLSYADSRSHPRRRRRSRIGRAMA
jgi:hypothetical protein